jgi:hypothetical protein
MISNKIFGVVKFKIVEFKVLAYFSALGVLGVELLGVS